MTKSRLSVLLLVWVTTFTSCKKDNEPAATAYQNRMADGQALEDNRLFSQSGVT